MSLEKEIRIAKLQIMWTIAVSTLGLYTAMQGEYLIGLVSILLYAVIWYLGAISLRVSIEKEIEKE